MFPDNKRQKSSLSVVIEQDAPIPLHVKFSCATNQLTALVGPSGSGKSTILRTIAGLYKPEFGKIRCGDACWYNSPRKIDLTPQMRRTGYVFQNYALMPHMCALENIEIALGHLPKSMREDRAKELLTIVNLKGLAARLPAELSGGQQQRIALARAMAREPSVLLLDEPFSAVDMVTRSKLHAELAQFRNKLDIPLVLVTHDLEEAVNLADQIVVIHQGKSLQCGTVRQVMSRPVSRLVARLVNIRNVLEATILEHDEGQKVTRLAWLDYVLEARLQKEFALGTRVSFAIPATHVVLHSRYRPSRGEHENPVMAVIHHMVTLGEYRRVTAKIGNQPDQLLSFSVPAHVADRNELKLGQEIGLSLLANAIHIMPL